jgi:hypothetical protein
VTSNPSAPASTSPLDVGERETFDGPEETSPSTGFRRVSPTPEPRALSRMRDLLLDAASDGSPALREALEGFHSWHCLETLCGSTWASGALRGSPAVRRVLRRRLRMLGMRPISVGQATALPVGSTIHLRGTIRSKPSGRLNSHMSHIWYQRAVTEHNVRFLVEHGHHFFLTDAEGQTARVIATRGYLVNGTELGPGDQCSVFGFTDRIADPSGQTTDVSARERTILAVRAGDDLPLIIRHVAQGE